MAEGGRHSSGVNSAGGWHPGGSVWTKPSLLQGMLLSPVVLGLGTRASCLPPPWFFLPGFHPVLCKFASKLPRGLAPGWKVLAPAEMDRGRTWQGACFRKNEFP